MDQWPFQRQGRRSSRARVIDVELCELCELAIESDIVLACSF